MRHLPNARKRTEGSALLEFAIVLPLLVVFIVGIYDFSGAYIQKQKIGHAAQAGAIAAAGQPTGDMDPTIGNPESLQPVVNVIFNSLAAEGVLPLANQGNCKPAAAIVSNSALKWIYSISDCWNYPADATPGCVSDPADKLRITIDRGRVEATPPVTVGTQVEVSYTYHWRFNSAIQLLIPGAGYSAKTCLSETATVHNQM